MFRRLAMPFKEISLLLLNCLYCRENIYSANDFDESYSDLSFTVYRSMARLLRKRLSGCVSPTAPYEILDVYLLRESDSFAALLVTVRWVPVLVVTRARNLATFQ